MLAQQTQTRVAINPRPLPQAAFSHSARLILPKADNSGNVLSWEWVNFLITAQFGGLTQSTGEGQWSDGGILCHDETLILDIDYSGNGEGGEYLAGLAQAVKEYASQETVYLRIDGQTYLI